MGEEAKMARWLYYFWLDQAGQDLVEYAVILMFIAVACLAFVYSGMGSVNGLWIKENTDLVSANRAAGGS
jgi:Flp pilus assembly pilin Flp